jgi:hypothetical protein
MVSLSAQSLTSSWSLPQNNSSMLCGFVMLQFPISICLSQP